MAETSSRQGPGSPWTVVPEMMMMMIITQLVSLFLWLYLENHWTFHNQQLMIPVRFLWSVLNLRQIYRKLFFFLPSGNFSIKSDCTLVISGTSLSSAPTFQHIAPFHRLGFLLLLSLLVVVCQI